LVVILLNAAFTIMMYCSYSLTGGDELRTLEDSFFSTWRMLFGHNELYGFVQNNRGLNGPKFAKGSSGAAYFFLTVLGNLIVMNIVVGLLGDQYQKYSKLSVLHFNRELNANLAKDIIAVKSAEGLNPFSFSLNFSFPTRSGGEWNWKPYRLNLGFSYLNNWKMDAKRDFIFKMMLLLEGYYLDWLTSHFPFQFDRLNSPAVLFRLKWFHGACCVVAQMSPRAFLFSFACRRCGAGAHGLQKVAQIPESVDNSARCRGGFGENINVCTRRPESRSCHMTCARSNVIVLCEQQRQFQHFFLTAVSSRLMQSHFAYFVCKSSKKHSKNGV
jgi:hypothetical protein